ncbi:MAG: glutathione synthase [Gammaproteobacteria bacterium]|nr:MAG: glutathione synthase [Gammaproteobacteria bacterium]
MKRMLGIVMDAIDTIKPAKDTSLAMLLEARRRGWALHYFEQSDLLVHDGVALGRYRQLEVRDDPTDWYRLGEEGLMRLDDLDCILMRKDPPFDMEYIYTTYILDLAAARGTLVVNRPDSLRDANEKFFITRFPQCIPETLVSRDMNRLRAFAEDLEDIVVKPLDGMGGASIFRIRKGDPNTNVILETLTDHGRRSIMAQRFLPEYREGDRRILLIDGEPVPYALARIPAEGEHRANLAAGGTGKGVPLGARDRWICEQIGPTLREMGLLFVGIDVIGDWLTEINVTSPTCVRELDAQFGCNIAGQLFDAIEQRLEAA